MRKSLFAGLTILEPDESVLSDDGAFIGRDRETIDRLLEVGAKTHRHTGLPGLPNPGLPLPSVQAIPSGGFIRGEVSFDVGYSFVDQEGGETLLSPTTTVTTAPPLSPPISAPSATVDYSAGALLVDTYYYALTYVDSEGGETPPGAWASVEREPGFPNAQVLLSTLDDGLPAASATGWRLYRAVGGAPFCYLSSGIVGQDAFTDNGSVAVECDVHPPPDEVNNTNALNQLRVVLPGSGAIGGASGIRLYATDTGEFMGDVLLDAYPVSSAGETVSFTSFDPLSGAPPSRNLSIGGASKIDPDTEILDWHWKRPVATTADLPDDGEEGDVRLVLDVHQAYAFIGGGWIVISGSGGGGGGSGTVRQVRASGGGTVNNPPSIIFAASGSAQVAVSNVGGSARVTIFASAGLGPPGPQGPIGSSGAPGASGAPGPPGASGAPGPAGASGAPGAPGSPGASGAPGPQGQIGPAGSANNLFAIRQVAASGNGSMFNASAIIFSASGSAGVAVEDIGGGSAHVTIFAQSSAGPPGPQGVPGASGAPGPAGASGAPGPAGASGAPGPAGASGAPGPAGASGAPGPAGASGAPGAQGPAGGGGGGSLRTRDGQTTVQPTTDILFDGVDLDDLGGGSARASVGGSALVANRASASIRAMLGYDAEAGASGRAVSFETGTPGMFMTALKRRSDTTVGTGSGVAFAASGFDAERQPMVNLASGQFADDAASTAQLAAAIAATVCEGRLTMTSGDPAPPTSSSQFLYFSPYKGNRVGLYNGSANVWGIHAFNEASFKVSQAASPGMQVQADTNYDVFIYNNLGTLTMELVAWASNNARATPLGRQDGVPVKSGDPARRYVGTVRGSTTGNLQDDTAKRFIWNYNNRLTRALSVATGSAGNTSWSQSVTGVFRQANNDQTHQVEFVTGFSEDMVEAHVLGAATFVSGTEAIAVVGVGVDSRTANSAQIRNDGGGDSGTATLQGPAGAYRGQPVAAGYHFLAWLEMVRGTHTWYGNNALVYLSCGLVATVWA